MQQNMFFWLQGSADDCEKVRQVCESRWELRDVRCVCTWSRWLEVVSERVWSCHGSHLIVEVGTVEGCGECDWLFDTQDLLTVLEDAAGCCGCEPEQWDFGELPFQDAQQFIIWTGTHIQLWQQNLEFYLKRGSWVFLEDLCFHTLHPGEADLSPGLKSCPHWLQQCTSSTAMRLNRFVL